MAIIQASADVEAAADVTRNAFDTNGVTATAGKLFGANNNKTEKFGIMYNGALDLTVGTVAAAGTTQGTATAITDPVTYVTGSDGTKGVVLPAVAAGLVYIVYDTVATSGLKIYPASGDDINDGTTDASVTIEGKTMAIFVGVDGVTWAAIYTANT